MRIWDTDTTEFSSLLSIANTVARTQIISYKHETRSTLNNFLCLTFAWMFMILVAVYLFVLHFPFHTFFIFGRICLLYDSVNVIVSQTYPMSGLEPARSWIFVHVSVTLFSVTLLARGVPGMGGNVLGSGVRCKFTLPLFSTYLRQLNESNKWNVLKFFSIYFYFAKL